MCTCMISIMILSDNSVNTAIIILDNEDVLEVLDS